MKLKPSTLKSAAYPIFKNMVIGSTLTLSMALISCSGNNSKNTETPPKLPDKVNHNNENTSKPENPDNYNKNHKSQNNNDKDKDGINDVDDKCPNRFGTKRNKGCPEVMMVGLIRAPNPPQKP
jgi:hypothetical protein